jgi:hypothetical protein
MATDPSFIEHVIDLCDLEGRLVARKMFGEYGFHLDGKFIALACDNSLFVKATASLENHGLSLPLRLDNPELLRQFMLDTAALLPVPKAKRPKKR